MPMQGGVEGGGAFSGAVPALEMDDCELEGAGWPLGKDECRLVELLAPTLDMEARVAESAATRHPHNTLQYSTVHVRADTGAVHASADPFLPYFLQIPVQLRYLYTQD